MYGVISLVITVIFRTEGIHMCTFCIQRSHSPEEKGDSWRKGIMGEGAKEAASAPELFPHTGHWPGREGSGSGGTSGSSLLYVGWEGCSL